MKGGTVREIKVAIIGTKFMGRAHANAYRQARAFFAQPIVPILYLACGTNPKETKDFAEKFGFSRYTTNWEEAVEDKKVELVDICGPNDLHAEIAVAAAKAGKAVFCEKPLARDLAEAKGMLRAVEEAGVPHMICFNYRFFPAIQLAKKTYFGWGLRRDPPIPCPLPSGLGPSPWSSPYLAVPKGEGRVRGFGRYRRAHRGPRALPCGRNR
jgi:hypothetical protein